jgi:fructokinase
LFGSIETGGTTTVCAVGSGPGDLHDRLTVATTTPAETIGALVAHLERRRGELAAVGVASFGPLDLDRRSAGYGRIMRTPKPGWEGADLIGPLARALGVPIALDTDVNGAALAEARWGAARGLDTFAYVTVGTGVGGGGLCAGALLSGRRHPEMGHMRLPRRDGDPLERGACPFHADCWEGWAAKPAIERRWGAGVRASDLGGGELELVAHYIAAGVVNIVRVLSPLRVILGGGIVLGDGASHRERLLALVRAQAVELLGGYPPYPEFAEQIDAYVVPAELGTDAGVLGGIELARRAADAAHRRAYRRPTT